MFTVYLLQLFSFQSVWRKPNPSEITIKTLKLIRIDCHAKRLQLLENRKYFKNCSILNNSLFLRKKRKQKEKKREEIFLHLRAAKDGTHSVTAAYVYQILSFSLNSRSPPISPSHMTESREQTCPKSGEHQFS